MVEGEREVGLVLHQPPDAPVELGVLTGDRLAQLGRLDDDAGLLAHLAYGGVDERLAGVDGSADAEPVRLLGRGRVPAVQEQHLALGVDREHAGADPVPDLPAVGPAFSRGHQSVPNSIAALSRARSSTSPFGRGVVGDHVAAAGLELAEQVSVLDQDLALVERLGGVDLELGARVGDVEVAHGELADPVGRAEDGFVGALHRQLVGVVGEVLALGAQDRVVLAPPQPQR